MTREIVITQPTDEQRGEAPESTDCDRGEIVAWSAFFWMIGFMCGSLFIVTVVAGRDADKVIHSIATERDNLKVELGTYRRALEQARKKIEHEKEEN